MTYALSRVVFFILFSLLGLRRAVIRDNLARSFPELDPAAQRKLRREFLRRQSELAAEVLLAPRIDPGELRERVTLVNPEVLASAAAPRPVILAGSHMGNFEWAQLRVSLELGDRLLALYKPMHNARVERWFHRPRTRFGGAARAGEIGAHGAREVPQAPAIGIIADQVPRSSPERHWTGFLEPGHRVLHGRRRCSAARCGRRCCSSTCAGSRAAVTSSTSIRSTRRARSASRGAVTERYARALERAIRATLPAGGGRTGAGSCAARVERRERRLSRRELRLEVLSRAARSSESRTAR